jgi:hypothetical protein
MLPRHDQARLHQALSQKNRFVRHYLVPIAYPVTFTLPARTELIDAQNWYEKEVPGLGRPLPRGGWHRGSAYECQSQQFPIVHKSIRRALLRRFPYALLFVIEADRTLTVIACFHGSRDPGQWQRRA